MVTFIERQPPIHFEIFRLTMMLSVLKIRMDSS
jgi:hypothetical protein